MQHILQAEARKHLYVSFLACQYDLPHPFLQMCHVPIAYRLHLSGELPYNIQVFECLLSDDLADLSYLLFEVANLNKILTRLDTPVCLAITMQLSELLSLTA